MLIRVTLYLTKNKNTQGKTIMGRPGITYLDVAQAATKLFEQGNRPSIEAVRHELGTGSNSTINRHLRTWREKQGNQQELESGLPESLLIAVKGLYEATKAEATAKISTIQAEADESVKSLKTTAQDLETKLAQTIQQQAATEQTLNLTQEEKFALERQLAETNKQLDKQASQYELSQTQLKDKVAEIQRLLEQLSHAQHNLEHYRESIREERYQERQRAEEKVTALESQCLILQQQLKNSEQKLTTLSQELAAVREVNQRNREAIDKLTNENHQHQLNIQQQKLTYEHLSEQYVVLIEEKGRLAEQHQSQQETMQQLQLNNEKLNTQQSNLEQALQKAEDALKLAIDKNLFLTQEKATLVSQLKHQLANSI